MPTRVPASDALRRSTGRRAAHAWSIVTVRRAPSQLRAGTRGVVAGTTLATLQAMIRRLAILGAALLAVACVDGSWDWGDDGTADPDAEQPTRVEAGRLIFAAFCPACHGVHAKGDGPVAASLRTPPADLTHIVARRGSFDSARIASFIDGRARIGAHGASDMPVWGRIYDDRNEAMLSDETLLSPSMIFDVVAYLESIQVDPARDDPE